MTRNMATSRGFGMTRKKRSICSSDRYLVVSLRRAFFLRPNGTSPAWSNCCFSWSNCSAVSADRSTPLAFAIIQLHQRGASFRWFFFTDAAARLHVAMFLVRSRPFLVGAGLAHVTVPQHADDSVHAFAGIGGRVFSRLRCFLVSFVWAGRRNPSTTSTRTKAP